ncbi:MAG: AMP-binding protein [Dehalococcoidales bacterium]
MSISSECKTIGELVNLQSQRHGSKPFIISPDGPRVITYQQLGECISRVVGSLRQQGVSKGDKVSILLPNIPEYAYILLGAMKLGAVANPVNIYLKAPELQFLLEHAESKVVVTSSEFLPLLEEVWQLWRRILPVAVLDEGDKDLHFQQSPISNPSSSTEVVAEDEAELLYTTGTIGRPKGVLLTHKNLLSEAQFIVDGHKFTENDRGLCLLPFFHINGQVVNLISGLLSGGSIILPCCFSASTFWFSLANYEATWFNAVPTIYCILLNRPKEEVAHLNLSKVKFGRSASAPLPVAVQKAFEERFQIPIIETYGISETASQVTTNPREVNERKLGSVGRAQGCEVKIVNKEGQELPRGQEGEIVVRGKNVTKGYYKDPEATAEALRDGWFHSGDLGYQDDQGFLFITGRLRELIIRGGENIAPREINDVLYSHPKIQEAATVGIPDPCYGEEVKSFVVVKPGQKCSEKELLDYCRQRLADFKCPKSISFLKEMPKSPGGKIISRKLVDLAK